MKARWILVVCLALGLLLPRMGAGIQAKGELPAAQVGSSISGRVTDKNGGGVEGVVVQAVRETRTIFLPVISKPGTSDAVRSQVPVVFQPANIPSTTTDAGGYFTLTDVPAGIYDLHLAQSGYLINPTILQQTVPPSVAGLEFAQQDIILSEQALIPAGSFQMGCDALHNAGYACDLYGTVGLPLHTVLLNAYRIDKTEVTNAQYAQCVVAGACAAPAKSISRTQLSYFGNPTYASFPVIFVNWQSAVNYCVWVGKRLPTEAEWEKAARGSGENRAYPWGDGWPNCTLANMYSTATSSYCLGDTTAVGSYPSGASPYGVLDMAGNVMEWTNDWFDANYYSNSPGSNPSGPASGTKKVQRGGSFWNTPWGTRTAYRDAPGFPTDRNDFIGFRCAVTSP